MCVSALKPEIKCSCPDFLFSNSTRGEHLGFSLDLLVCNQTPHSMTSHLHVAHVLRSVYIKLQLSTIRLCVCAIKCYKKRQLVQDRKARLESFLFPLLTPKFVQVCVDRGSLSTRSVESAKPSRLEDDDDKLEAYVHLEASRQGQGQKQSDDFSTS